MISLSALLWVFITFFAFIGSTRGWAKEMLVTFSVILGLFILTVFKLWVPFIKDLTGAPLFWLRFVVIVLVVFFGYQGPSIPKLAGTNRFAREKVQDSLFGIFMGAINGYLIFGTIWFFLNEAGYPFDFIQPPKLSPEALTSLMNLLPPGWLVSPLIYFAVAIAFVFVLVVFI